ncbi:uncharacterized protein BT62DRAFT_937252 [Guyanagaster necrorhizus]|uniref:SHSP domain-containing protein n=1 Tax=Guyanagaster necrorhizus TaxID=856835 RepID=A0A9P8ANZ0_9AGAR|nr:uncharacterized protein BT62DRAFT_937252 [Guyanagaster necrorhizus MCA 3950]KAG7441337.1 hypothetical protein BT62DRAFT_937252 [Guyanagaster necrorhizus MCA 3950]
MYTQTVQPEHLSAAGQSSPIDNNTIQLLPVPQPRSEPPTRGRQHLRRTPPRSREHRAHPYVRPGSAAGPSQNQDPVIRFVPPILAPVRAPTGPPTPQRPRSSPVSVGSRERTSTSLLLSQASRTLFIRFDWRYDPETTTITAHFELPGVKREDISIRLWTCFYNHSRQVTVYATRHAPFPGATTSRDPAPGSEIFWIEGKYGQCKRSIVVSPDCKPEDIDARYEDGILVLKIQCGPPDDKNEVQMVPLR